MNFSDYKNFTDNHKKEYGSYASKYPHAFLALHFPSHLRVLQKYERTWVKPEHLQTYFNSTTALDPMKHLYSIFLKIALFFKMKSSNSKLTIHSSISDSNFPGFTDVLSKITKKNNWNLIYPITPSTSFWDIFSLKAISPYQTLLSMKTKKILSKFNVDTDQEWFDLLDNDQLMSALDDSLLNDVYQAAKLTCRLAVSIYINTGDTSAQARILVSASKINNFKVVSIAHGYATDDKLCGFAPVMSDKLILWTQKQLNDMSDVLPPEQSKKLSFIGFPKKYLSQAPTTSDAPILMLAGFIEPILLNKESKNILTHTISELQKMSDNFKLRLHPHERHGVKIIEQFLAKHSIDVSVDNLEEDIANARLIIGMHTSTLIEAASTGKAVFEIKELAHHYSHYTVHAFEAVHSISYQDLNRLNLTQIDNFSESYLKFDEEKMSIELQELLCSLAPA
ncbi:hypothetical protein OAH78_02830 [Gammaproteobacteria bacterium]|nr:hypothetical protein [Gammaproteobacteria bacterium]